MSDIDVQCVKTALVNAIDCVWDTDVSENAKLISSMNVTNFTNLKSFNLLYANFIEST